MKTITNVSIMIWYDAVQYVNNLKLTHFRSGLVHFRSGQVHFSRSLSERASGLKSNVEPWFGLNVPLKVSKYDRFLVSKAMLTYP